MNFDIKEFINQNRSIINSIITIIIGYIIYRIIISLIKKTILKRRNTKKIDPRKLTIIHASTSIIRATVVICVILIIMKNFGIDVSSFVVGLGVASAVVGLALQDALKDIIMGTNIMLNNYFNIDDIVQYEDFIGKVIEFNMRCTKIKSIVNGNILNISNRNIDKITLVSNELYIKVQTRYEDTQEKLAPVFYEIQEKIKEIEDIELCENLGASALNDSSVGYTIKIILLKPDYYIRVSRKAIQIIKSTFDKKGIIIPYNQIEVHNSK